MANKKSGFAYYQTDTDRYLDIKIKRIKSKFGCTGIAVFDYILAAIYRDKGYWVEWDEHLRFDVSDYFNLEESIVDEIVKYGIDLKLFHEGIYTKRKVLTSSSIQVRYVEMSKTCRRNDYSILPELDVENHPYSNIPPNNPAIPPNNEPILPSNTGTLPHTNVTNVNNVNVPAADYSIGTPLPISSFEKVYPDSDKNQIPKKQTVPAAEPKKRNRRGPDEELSDPFSPGLGSIWERWVKFTKARSPKPFPNMTQNSQMQSLYELSGGNLELAWKIVNKAIEGNWTKFYGLKEDYQKPNGSTNGHFVHPDHNLSSGGLAGKTGIWTPQKHQP